jgi:hypothetical protein
VTSDGKLAPLRGRKYSPAARGRRWCLRISLIYNIQLINLIPDFILVLVHWVTYANPPRCAGGLRTVRHGRSVARTG